MKQIFFAVLFLISFDGYAQNCETFDRELIHFLPKDFPDTINCIDNLSKKQGYWIEYIILYNEVMIPDVLNKGNYVPRYCYGQYKDDKKIGIWKFVENVHLVYESKIEHYNYYGDSLVVTTVYPGRMDPKIYYLKEDSSVFKYECQLLEDFPTIIQCNKKSKKSNACFIVYRDEIFKRFPLKELEFQIDNYRHLYQRERILIDRKRTKQ